MIEQPLISIPTLLRSSIQDRLFLVTSSCRAILNENNTPSPGRVTYNDGATLRAMVNGKIPPQFPLLTG